MQIERIDAAEAARVAAGEQYVQFLNAGSMSAGLYVLEAGGVDSQTPHDEDEIYYVLAGASRFTSGDETRAVNQGDVIFVPALEPHRFHDIEQDLILLVIFAPEHNRR